MVVYQAADVRGDSDEGGEAMSRYGYHSGRRQGERDEELRAALRGLLNVAHAYLPNHMRACLKFQDNATCINTGDTDPCELCAARKALEE